MATSNLCFVLSSQNSRAVAPPTVRTFPEKVSPGSASTCYFHGLPGLEIGAIRLSDLRRNLQMRAVNHFRNRTSGIHLIPDVIIRQRHPIHKESARGIAVAVNDHQPIDRRRDPHVLDVQLRVIHRQMRLVMFFLADRQRRIIRSAVRLDVLFQLRQSALGFFEREKVFLRVDRADQFILADLEFRFAHRVLCFQQCRLVFRRLHRGICLGFDDLLIGLLQVAAVLRQVVFLLAGVKLQHHVSGVHLRSGSAPVE